MNNTARVKKEEKQRKESQIYVYIEGRREAVIH